MQSIGNGGASHNEDEIPLSEMQVLSGFVADAIMGQLHNRLKRMEDHLALLVARTPLEAPAPRLISEGPEANLHMAMETAAAAEQWFEGENPTKAQAKEAVAVIPIAAPTNAPYCRSPSKHSVHTKSSKAWKSEDSFASKMDMSRMKMEPTKSVPDWCLPLKEPPRTGEFAACMRSQLVDNFFFFVIVANLCFSVHRLNDQARTLEHITETEQVVERVFIGVFTLEILLKIAVHKIYFFLNEERGWNFLDTFIVVISIVEQVLLELSPEGGSFAFMRVIRVLRVCKILRIVRAARFLKDLRVIVSCLVGSVMTLLWCCVLMALMILIFAMCFIQHVTSYRLDHPDICVEDEQYCKAAEEDFSSVQGTMLALFQAVTGGKEWSSIYDIVGRSGVLPRIQVVLFIVFFFFAFFNIITSIFVDRAMTLAQPDHEEKILKQTEEDHQITMDMRELFEEMDKDGKGYITAAEVNEFKDDPYIIDCLELGGLSAKDVPQFFQYLHHTCEQKELDIDIFVRAVFQMKGVASALEVNTLLFQMNDVHKSLRRIESRR